MNKILRDNRFTAKQQAIAEAVITSRLICPGSDLSTWKWLKDRTSLGELLNINIDNIGIAAKDNIKLIIDRGYSYIVIEHRAVHKDYIDEFKTATETFTKIEMICQHFFGQFFTEQLKILLEFFVLYIYVRLKTNLI